MLNTTIYKDNDFIINRVKNYHAVLLVTKRCEMTLFDDNGSICIPSHTIALLEKGMLFNLKLIINGEGGSYDTFLIEDKIIAIVLKVFETTCATDKRTFPVLTRKIENRVFVIDTCELEDSYFYKIIESKEDETLLVFKLAYLLSKMSNREDLLFSLSVSASRSFSDKVREIVENKLEKKWKISDIAEAFHCSEITVRKKLEKEMMTFNQIMLDIRMNHASKLILSTDCNVNSVSSAIGIASTSYFIKLFKCYYGVTPKQYYLTLKR